MPLPCRRGRRQPRAQRRRRLRLHCDRRSGHPLMGEYQWLVAPEPPDIAGVSGLAEELELQVELPAALARYAGRWIEYGVLEAAYAEANPKDFAQLVERYGHTAIAATRYSASAFIAATLGRLTRTGDGLFHPGRRRDAGSPTVRSPGGPFPRSLTGTQERHGKTWGSPWPTSRATQSEPRVRNGARPAPIAPRLAVSLVTPDHGVSVCRRRLSGGSRARSHPDAHRAPTPKASHERRGQSPLRARPVNDSHDGC